MGVCYITFHGAINFAVNGIGTYYKMLLGLWNFADQTTMHVVISNVYQVIVAVVVVLTIGLRIPNRYRVIGLCLIALLNWAIVYLGIFVPQKQISAHILILFPIIVVTILHALFRIADLDYLFP